jgi:hypothetical protein
VALEAPADNCPEILTDLEVVLGSKYTKIQYSVSVQNTSYSYGAAYMQIAQSQTEFYIKFFVDQKALIDSPSIDIFTQVEHKVTDMLYFTGGAYFQRVVDPFRDKYPTLLHYTLKLENYNDFIQKLHQLARSISDKEFTKALEGKLFED